jgi:MFS family permease
MSICNSWQQIGGLRILIGCGEAFIQAAYLYLTFFYKREELATRGGILYSMVAVSGSANGLIAYVLLKNMNGVRGWLAWRWMFLIEGKSRT